MIHDPSPNVERGCWLLLYVLMPNPTTDQLRNNIDAGQTGEKIAMPDPATVPLGTDAEAGGSPPTAKERQLEAAVAPKAPAGENSRALPGGMIYLVLVALLAIALIGIVMLAAS